MGVCIIAILSVLLFGWFMHDCFKWRYFNSLTSKTLDFRGFYFLPMVAYTDYKMNKIRGVYIGWFCFLIFIPMKKKEKAV